MVELRDLLLVRSAYAGRFDASGEHLAFVADLGGVPQAWGVAEKGWPELLLAPPDRVQSIHPGPRPGQLVVGADIGGNEHTQLLYSAQPGDPWRALSLNLERIYSFGGFSADGETISFAANTRTPRWFDIYLQDLKTGEMRCVLEHDSNNHAGPFSPDGRWLIVVRSFSNTRAERCLVDITGVDPPRLLTPPNEGAVAR